MANSKCELCGDALEINSNETVAKQTISTEGNTNKITLLKRVFMFLEDGNWSAADQYCEKVLDIDPECADAYLGKLLAELKVHKKEQLRDCKNTFEERNNCQKAMRFGDEAFTAFVKDCTKYINERNEAERKAKRNKKIAIIATSIICVVVTFVIVLNTVIIPNGNIKTLKPGDYVFFGAYEQDNNTTNGKEDIEWLILDVQDGKALVISKYALDCKQYNTSCTDVTWETCTLREWLNHDFINAAFSAEEIAMIHTVTVPADENPSYGTTPGNATRDQVFLLSITESNKYFSSWSARQCEPTDYAIANGAWEDAGEVRGGYCIWSLRTSGKSQDYVAFVYSNGAVIEGGDDVDYDNRAVRPAMWVDLSMIEG